MSDHQRRGWARRWPLLVLVATAAGLVAFGAKLVETERLTADFRAREKLREELSLSSGRLHAAILVLETRTSPGGDAMHVALGGRFVIPPEPELLEPLPPPPASDTRGRFFLDLGASNENGGKLEAAASAWQACAGEDHHALCRAHASFRLAGLRERGADANEASRWRAAFVALLPDLPADARTSREALLMRSRLQPPDAALVGDLALLLGGADDTIARGLLVTAGMSDAPAVRARYEELALMDSLRPLLPTSDDADSGIRGTGDILLAWRRQPDGSFRVASSPPPAGLRLVDGTTPLPEPGSPVIEERGPSPISGWQLAASRSRREVESEADRSAMLKLATISVLVAGAGLAAWLSLRAWRRELQASRERLAFVARVGHDLRTPLASIRLYAETLAAGRVDTTEDAQDFARTVASEAERLTALVDRVLDLGRLDADAPLERVPVDVCVLVAEVIEGFRPLAAEAGVPLDFEAPETELRVTGDPAALRGLVANLLDNALVHGGPGGQVEVQISQEEAWVTIEVLDRGPGLPDGTESRLFERFVRGPAVSARGAGLGLAVVREIAVAHGGSVFAESRGGGGARFRVRLPVG